MSSKQMCELKMNRQHNLESIGRLVIAGPKWGAEDRVRGEATIRNLINQSIAIETKLSQPAPRKCR